MKLREDLHKLLDKKKVALLDQYNIKTLAQLLSTKPEKLSSILSISYTALCHMRKELFAVHASVTADGLEQYQHQVENEVRCKENQLTLSFNIHSLVNPSLQINF